MDHGSPVRRSFLSDAETTANLSEEALSLFDSADPDAPAELGRVDIAPNYTQVFVYGDHVARVRDRAYYYSPSGQGAVDGARVEILPRAGSLDTDEPVASISARAARSSSRSATCWSAS